MKELEQIERTVYDKGLDDPGSFAHRGYDDVAFCGFQGPLKLHMVPAPEYCPTCLMKNGGPW